MFEFLPAPLTFLLARLLLLVLAVLVLWLIKKLVFSALHFALSQILKRLKVPEYKEPLFEVIRLPLNIFLIAILLRFAGAVFSDQSGFSDLMRDLSRVLASFATVIAVYRVISFILSDTVRAKGLLSVKVQPDLIPFIRTAVQVLVIILGILLILQSSGFEVSSLITALGISSLAISLAAQDTLSNLFGFLAIVGDRPFVVGDYIKTPDVEGTVISVGVRSTRIRQTDQSYVTVPNTTLANAAIVNATQITKRLVDITVGVPYTTHTAALHNALEQVRSSLRSDQAIDQESINVFLRKIGAQSLEIMVRFYVLVRDYKQFMQIQEKLIFDVMKILDDNNLKIISSTNTMYVTNLDGGQRGVMKDDEMLQPGDA
ncbi:MAG: mechanosensitive ion channel protein MscS [Chloroflexi bacterium OLB15]|nr:MAG: mechanosensitive ion channel protein MscS [Chloroflexi bacterium OLB15]